jgi:group I intron endonuclease
MHVYIIQNNTNGDVYIGKAKNIKDRWYNHLYYHRKNPLSHYHLYRAFTKYGVDNFNVSLLETFSSEIEALEAEVWWISYLRYCGAELYNMTPGGEGVSIPCSEKKKQRLRDNMTPERRLELSQIGIDASIRQKAEGAYDKYMDQSLQYENDFSNFDEDNEDDEF